MASSAPVLPYLAELTDVMTNTVARRAMAEKLLMRCWEWSGRWWKKIDHKKLPYRTGIDTSASACSHISCVFGEFAGDRYDFKGYNYGNARASYGIEILNARPNATGHTYSNKCLITVKELKEVCKANGIKTTGLDKRGLLSALMKV